MERYQYISIEGNIGAGKTTLSKMLAERFSGKLILEAFDDNPFLPKFYKEPDKFAFPLELSFLAERYNQLKEDANSPDLFNKMIISDYFIGKSLIFAKNNLDEDELRLFQNIFKIMFSSLPKPDLLVYLHIGVDRLQRNIKKRGREYEKSIKSEYLTNIHEGYLEFLKQLSDVKILVLDLGEIDFVEKKEHFDLLIDVIDREYARGLHIERVAE